MVGVVSFGVGRPAVDGDVKGVLVKRATFGRSEIVVDEVVR